MLAFGLLALAVGVLSHVAYFNRFGEHHMWSNMYIQFFLLACIGTTTAFVKFADYEIGAAVSVSSALAVSYLAGLYTSLVIYRLFLSPLRKFPGPWQARISSLWFLTKLGKLNAYRELDEMHKKYGQYVRIGSNDLSISDPCAMEPAYGQGSKCTKGSWYDGSSPYDSLHSTRSKALHDRRRRIWAPAFSDKALRDYEHKVKVFNLKLDQRIAEHKGGSINATKWFNLWSFDVMGQLAFGKDYRMLESGDRHWALDVLTEGMTAVGPRPPTWLFRILVTVPGLAAGFFKFLRFCRDELGARAKDKTASGDITQWLLKHYEGWEHPEQDPMFQGDSRLIIVAGSDTTSAAITYLFYELAQRPEEVKKLRQELTPLAIGDWGDKEIKNAPRLNGAINEAFRLHPPVPSGVSRLTPLEGLQVGDVFVPGDVEFWMPQYVMGRDEATYEDADSFVPERWFSKPNMIKHKDAFAPFSMGPYGCIGKNLAYLELRTMTTQLLLKYDVALAPGEDGHRLLYKSKDHFTMGLSECDMMFTPVVS